MLTGPHNIPEEKIEKIIITLHGYGANGDDLHDCGTFIANNLNQNIAVYSPHAVETFEMNTSGYQWFGLPDLHQVTLETGIYKALPALLTFIDTVVKKHDLTDQDVILFGFSQGCMMALAAMYFKNFHAVIGVAGVLIKHNNPEILKPQTPVFLAHGTYDMVVTYPNMLMSQELLHQDNISVKTLTRPGLGHGIDDTILKESVSFLKNLPL
jgi:phospholipase/carboxylesterase